MRGPARLVLALVAAGLLAGCVQPWTAPDAPQEALPPLDIEPVDTFELMREVRAVTNGLDSASPPSYFELARTRLANLSARVDGHVAERTISPEDANATRAAIAEEEDRVFWTEIAAAARADPASAFVLAENKTAQAETRLANATEFADVGKARSDLLHAQAILVAIEVYHPTSVDAAAYDALVQRVEADLARTDAWTPG